MITLKYIKNAEGKATPTIASFQQNMPDGDMLKQLDFSLCEFKEQRKKKKVLLAENDKFSFISKSIDQNQSSKYLIGVIYDKEDEANEMKIYDIDQIFALKQITKSQINQGQIQTNVAQSGSTIWDQKLTLVQEMGTLKAQRKVQQMMTNRVEEKNISSVSNMNFLLKQKSEDLKDKKNKEEEELKQQEIQSKREFLPEFNLETNNVAEIYDLNSIISQEEWDYLAVEPYIVALKKQKISTEIQNMSQYVQDLFNNFDLLFADRPMQKSPIIKYLIYLDYLIRVSYKPKFLKNNIDEVAKELRIDSLFVKNIVTKFYQITPSNDNKISYSRSGALRDKLYCYIITLTLFAFNYKLDAAPLAKHLKIEPKRFIQLAKEIGCTTIIKENKQEDNSLISQQINIELKAPLKLQLMSSMNSNRKFKK